MTARVRDLLAGKPVIPVVVIDKAEHGPPMAEALLAGGIDCVEITLRTEAALGAAERIIQTSEIIVGLGTVMEADQLRFATEIGARFAVSPGINEDLVSTAAQEKIPYLPGTSTASEVMLARDMYCEVVKYFPAFIAPGITSYPHVAAVVPHMSFCLTGGVGQSNLSETLAMRGVMSVGGSWIASREAIAAEDWAGITERARIAMRTANPAEQQAAQA